ncbi:MAG: glycosyltransferase family 4 protein [Halobacteriota archaeon]
MRVGILAANLSVYGGGEKYVCKIAEIFSREHDVDLIAFDIPEREVAGVLKTLENRLNVNLRDVNLKVLATPGIVGIAMKNSFIDRLIQSTVVSKCSKHYNLFSFVDLLTKSVVVSKCSKHYDLFINQSGGGLFLQGPAYANKNIMIIQVPPTNEKIPFPFGCTGLKLFVDSNLSTYDRIVVYSNFVKTTVEQKYTRKAEVLYPPIESQPDHCILKEHYILSVGRFGVGEHSKKQLEMIQAFKQLCKDGELDEGHWEYHLVGVVLSKQSSQLYKRICEKEAEGYPIFFHFNAPYKTVKDLYSRSTLFWHATGFNEDENKHPEKMEHFGLVTAEAMSYGCIPIVVGKGGQPEIVHHGLNGLLWNTIEELKGSTLNLVNDPEKRAKLAKAAIETSRQFTTDQFEIKVKELLI